ncbi:MAG: helix-turn-helix transcriptional regulator [Chloroflexi bacterium]|mgnify:CR=1 FL=1|jgi:transcriptional regulator with XRE-family HTH domain|nr:helix-turn-helix transcriptional regulator [Chloroflexota bacterium]
MNRLREIRLQKGLNQRQLSEKAHTPQSIVSALERDVHRPWPNVANRISDALGVSIEEIFPEDVERLRRDGPKGGVKTKCD